MPIWPYRYQLSDKHRLRRSVYEVLRDQMDTFLIQKALIDSYRNFIDAGEPYPFVHKRELKPRARVVEQEYIHQNHFLVLFCEGTIPREYKKYIRFFDNNKITKEYINEFVHIKLHKQYSKNLRYFDNPDFSTLLFDLTPVDYALLIQQDTSIKRQNRYVMTHFHVRIDYPLDEATEIMAQQLRYISKDLYEQGEKYAQSLTYKLFEMYGFHHVVGGRRTAAVVAAQLLKKMPFISTVYVGSAESRTLARISERGVSKYVLAKLPIAEIKRLSKERRSEFDKFVEEFIIDINDQFGVAILHVVYRSSIYSKSPEDGKLRELFPDYQWLTIIDQLIIPLPEHPNIYPIPYSTVYISD